MDNSETGNKTLGIAIDIGTTTLAAMLVNMDSGEALRGISMANPQIPLGLDVLERVNAIEKNKTLLHELSESLTAACASLVRKLAADTPVKTVTVAGNSIMEHLFLGVSPLSMAKVPYKPVFKEGRTMRAAEAGLDTAGECELYLFPMVGGFVGGDAVAAALALGMIEEKENTLLIDVGTNSEVILKAGGRLYSTSAAAGPAFEAAGISCGMTACDGAIRGLSLRDNTISLDIIGNVMPRGICGSGLLDAVSTLLKAGIIDSTGRILEAHEVSSSLSGRIKANTGGNQFILSRTAAKTISITQADIRALQVAKAAIRAGITTLIEKAGLSTEDIAKVHIAGAFGSNLTMRGLFDVGLMDRLWSDIVAFAGDAALQGAAMALKDDKRAEAEWLAENITYQPLSGSKVFEREFIRHMDFPALDSE